MFNFEVHRSHTYFVGGGVLVHNDHPPKEAPKGRTGKQKRLRELGEDPKVSSRDRGWIKQEQNQIKRGKRKNIRVPPGKEMAHRRGKEARKGHGYEHSDLQDKDLHKLQHKHEGYK